MSTALFARVASPARTSSRRRAPSARPTLTLTIDGVAYGAQCQAYEDPDDGSGDLSVALTGPDGRTFHVTQAPSCGLCGISTPWGERARATATCRHIDAARETGLI